MYDFYLGGKDNYMVDRNAAREVLRVAPEIRATARVILSFRVSWGCDLRLPVADIVRNGKPLVLCGAFQVVGLLPD
jgi:S-adenosyl methyltransferase